MLSLRPTAEDLAPMLQVLHSFYPIKKGARRFLLKNTLSRFAAKGQLLLKSGEICDRIYFIKKGALRGFITEADKDVITWITVENEMKS